MNGNGSFRVLTIVGARPQFIKAGPVSRALDADGRFEEITVHTGQHFDQNMSEVFFTELELREPAYNLGICQGTHGAMTGRMLEGLERIMLDERPDLVLIYGDTNSTLAGAIAATKMHLPVAHVEAGLRSFNRKMPEEINRVLADHASDLLLCPTSAAVANLKREGIERGVYHVGDVMYDATVDARERVQQRRGVAAELNLPGTRYTLVTIHRAENTDSAGRLRTIVDYVRAQANGERVVLPLHPRTRKVVAEGEIDLSGFLVIDPVGYLDMQGLLDGAVEVMTDSGGVQKEAYFHRKPCVTLRDETEWVETVDAGWNRLWNVSKYEVPRREIDEFGDGHAAGRIVERLAEIVES